MSNGEKEVAVLFSGGTDSTASAAILAGQYEAVHLLTFARHGFFGADNSSYNASKLIARFPGTRISHKVLETTPLAKYVTNNRRWHYIRKYGFFTLQNCGFCALLNHLGTLAYCLKHGIKNSADGITHDWPFFPGHMDKVIDRFREWYASFGITYHTPVLHFEIDRPMTYIDKISGFQSAHDEKPDANTTGRLLHRMGLSDTDNYKGTEIDKKAQARCYQFAIPNLFIYWMFRGPERWDEYESIVVEYFSSLMEDSKTLVKAYFEHGRHRELFAFLDEKS